MRVLTTLLLALVALSGCAATQPRTGTIVVQPFATTDFRTNNHLQVSPEAVSRMERELNQHILKELKNESKLTIGKDCMTADFELTGKIDEVKAKFDSHWRVVTVTVNQEFAVNVLAWLKDCKTGKVLVESERSEDDEDLSNALDNIAGSIVKDISRVQATQ